MGCSASTDKGRETSAASPRKVPPTAENFFPQPNSAPPTKPTVIAEKQSPPPSSTPTNNETTVPAPAESSLAKKKETYTPPPAIGYEQTGAAGEVAVSNSISPAPPSAPVVVAAAPTPAATAAAGSSPKIDKKPYVPPAPIHLPGVSSSAADRSPTRPTATIGTSLISGITPVTNNRTSNGLHPQEDEFEEADEAESLEGSLDTSDVLFSADDHANVEGGGSIDLLGEFEASKGLLEEIAATTAKNNIVVADNRKQPPQQTRQHSMASLASLITPQPSSESGMRFDELYRLKGVLGTGAFSTVREGFHRSNSEMSYAVKCVNRKKLSEEDEAALLDEVGILKEMKHIHIIRLYDFFEEPSTYYLVLERMRGGELFDRIVAKAYYTEKEARDTCRIVLEAVGYCHENHIAHRDLKPENLLLLSEVHDSDVKIADFGFAKKVFEKNTLSTQCGTPGYVAPEILEGTPYDERADMWSVGVILYILLGGYPPFIESTQRDLFRKIRKGEYEFHEEYWGTVSTEAKDLISSLLTVDAEKRLTADEALENPWITQDDAKLAKKDLGVNLQKFRNFNAKRKFRAAVNSIIAVHKLNSLKEEFFTSLKDTTVQIVAEKSHSQRTLNVDA